MSLGILYRPLSSERVKGGCTKRHLTARVPFSLVLCLPFGVRPSFGWPVVRRNASISRAQLLFRHGLHHYQCGEPLQTAQHVMGHARYTPRQFLLPVSNIPSIYLWYEGRRRSAREFFLSASLVSDLGGERPHRRKMRMTIMDRFRG